MRITLEHKEKVYQCDLGKPIDISIPVGDVKCFYATDFEIQPYKAGNFVGSIEAGAPVNFFDVRMNPHGNGTHTECLGHITEQQESINDQLKQFHFIAELVSIEFEENAEGDLVISKNALKKACPKPSTKAFIIRTLPNSNNKLKKDYSGTNPPYLDLEAMQFLVQNGIKHLLLDLPSVDKEIDEGKLVSHHLFWNVENNKDKDGSRSDCTITELIYVPDAVEDGLYFLNIQIPSLNLDAAPSKPVLYRLEAQ